MLGAFGGGLYLHYGTGVVQRVMLGRRLAAQARRRAGTDAVDKRPIQDEIERQYLYKIQ